MYQPQQMLSNNRKTGCSINFPIKGHCRPTKNCKKDCYAKTGPIAFKNAKRKHDFMSTYMKSKNIKVLIAECKQRTIVRVSGSGDLLMDHVPNLLKLARKSPLTLFWGTTRKIEIAKALNNKIKNLKMLFSIDSTTLKKDLKYKGKMCFGPRHKNDKVPDSKQIITIFPYHCHGKIVGDQKKHPKDCPSIRTHEGCFNCGRCWNW